MCSFGRMQQLLLICSANTVRENVCKYRWGRLFFDTDKEQKIRAHCSSLKSSEFESGWSKEKKTHTCLPPSSITIVLQADLFFSASSSTLKLHVTQHYFKITNTTQLAKNDQQSSEIHIHMFCVKKHQGCDIVSNSVRKYVHVIFFSKIKLAK